MAGLLDNPNNPFGYKKGAQKPINNMSSLLDFAMQANQYAPVTGDIQSGIMAANDLSQGNYSNAALNAVGLLPFVPSMAGTIGKDVAKNLDNGLEYIYHGTTPKAAKAIEKSGFDLTKSADGTIWFTSNPNIGEVAASGSGAVLKRGLDKNMKLGGWDETDKYSTDELINMGYDGLKLIDNGETTYQIFNPEKLKKVIK